VPRADQLRRPEDGGNHRREAQRRQEKETDRADVFLPQVDPVCRPPVDEFEDPPGKDRDGKHARIPGGVPGQRRGALPEENGGVDRQAVAQPEGEEPPVRPGSGKQPVEGPEDGDEGESDPAAPGPSAERIRHGLDFL